MIKRVLLIGDSLQMGLSTVNPLMDEYQLRVFINKPIKLQNEEKVEHFYGDLNNYEDVLLAVTGCDMVVVSATTSKIGTPATGIENIRRAIAQTGVKRVIYTPSKNKRNHNESNPAQDSVAFNHWG